MDPDWQVDEHVVYETRWWRLYNDDIKRTDGTETTYVWSRTTSGRGAVMCIPRTADDQFLLIRIYRHPMRRYAWEFVAGLIEADESPEYAAMREIQEEVGVRPISLEVFPSYVPISGFVGDRFYIVSAIIPNVTLDDLKLQADEGITEAKFVSGEELQAMVRTGQIEDGITLVALAHFWAAQESK